MKTVRCQNIEDGVKKLQEYVDNAWGEKRRWLKSVPKDSYDEKRYRVELWVLDGSPVKQIVIINHNSHEIYCFDRLLYKQARFIWPPHEDFY